MHLLFVGKLQDTGFGPSKMGETDFVALEDGYLERLFLKESNEEGQHFDAPASVSKIVNAPPTIPINTLSPQPALFHPFNSISLKGAVLIRVCSPTLSNNSIFPWTIC
jgi:hypothetical protein